MQAPIPYQSGTACAGI